MSEPDERLRTLLGADPPASVLALDDAARTALAAVLEDARRRQAESLERTFAATIKAVPLPLRGVARKMLFG